MWLKKASADSQLGKLQKPMDCIKVSALLNGFTKNREKGEPIGLIKEERGLDAKSWLPILFEIAPFILDG